MSRMTRISPPLAWSLWAIATFFYAYQYVLRVSPGILIEEIMCKFSVEATHYGVFSGVYYLGYALMHLPLGLLLDRYSAKWILSLSALVAVIGILPLIASESWMLSVMGGFLIGAGSSAAIFGVFKVIQLSFDEKYFARLLSFSVTIGLLGAIYGSKPVCELNALFGWEKVLLILFCVGIALSIAMAIFIPSHKGGRGLSSRPVWGDLKALFRQKEVVMIAFFAALMVGPLEGFADVWSISFLETIYGYDHLTAASIPSYIFFGMCLGAPVLAAVSEKLNAYRGFIIVSAFGMAGLFLSILFFKPDMWLVKAVFFIMGVLCSYQVLAISLAITRSREGQGGLASSLTNMVIMAFGYVFHFLISQGMTFSWKGTLVKGVPLYEFSDYTTGLLVIPFFLVVAGMGFLFLKKLSKK